MRASTAGCEGSPLILTRAPAQDAVDGLEAHLLPSCGLPRQELDKVRQPFALSTTQNVTPQEISLQEHPLASHMQHAVTIDSALHADCRLPCLQTIAGSVAPP